MIEEMYATSQRGPMERKANLLISVFADASYTQSDRCAGYAWWARGDIERIAGSAGITWPVPHISEAESVALSVGICEALEKLPLKPGGGLVAQSDSLHALQLYLRCGYGTAAKTSDCRIYGHEAPKNSTDVQLAFTRDAIDRLKDANVKLWLKHVRAHTGEEAARSKVNEWCDTEAKKQRRIVQGNIKRMGCWPGPRGKII